MLGQIVQFAGNNIPRGWKYCDGSVLLITYYRRLYELIGTTYGGDGDTTFGLPNLGGRYIILVDGENETLSIEEIPSYDYPGALASNLVQYVTYAELMDLISDDLLVPGQQYLISDFAARWYMQNLLSPIVDSEQTGVTEPLLVTASTTSTLFSQCLSTLYPEDIVFYDWNPTNYVANFGLGDYTYDSFYAITSTIISDFKGVITRRIDTKDNVDAPFDWRNLTFRRWAVDPDVWDSGTAYSVNDGIQYNNVLYACIQASTNNTPDSSPTYWQPLLSADISSDPYWSTGSTGFVFSRGGAPLSCPVSASYQDYKVFGGYKVRDVRILGSSPSALNSVFKQSADYQSYGFEIGYYSYLNTVGSGFIGNKIGNAFQSNVIGTNFQYCDIGYECVGNFLLNTFQYNKTRGTFKYNWIAGSCTDCDFARTFESNTIKSGFTSNAVGYNFKTNNYTAATLVYNSYNKSLSKSPDGTKWLSYISNAGALTIVSHTT